MLRTLGLASIAFVAGGAIAFGCQKTDDRPAYIDTECEAGAKCGEPGPIGIGSGGSAGLDAQGDVGASTDVSGTIALIASDDFVTAVPFGDPATITLEDPSGAPVSGQYDGNSFSVGGAVISPTGWASVIPTIAGDAMTTLQPIDTTQPSPFQLLVVNRSVLQLIYSVLTIPTVPTDDTAQVVLHFVDAGTGKPLAGAKVSHSGAETIAYDAAGSYSDAVAETGANGIAIIVNVPAVTQRTSQEVQIQTQTATGTLEIAMQAGAITLTDVLIDP